MTRSMFELKIPVPIRTLGATVVIEGELPGFRHGVVYPVWDADVSGSYWGGTGTPEGPLWDSGTSYFVDDVVEKGGLVFLADDPISAGHDPFLGAQSGGQTYLAMLGGETPYGARQQFRLSVAVTCTGCEVYGYDLASGYGLKTGLRVAITDGTFTGVGNYDSFTRLAEGTYQGPNADGWGHIQFDAPVRLAAMTQYWVLVDGNNSVNPSAVLGSHYPELLSGGISSPIFDIGDWLTGITTYGSNIAGGNADSRMLFRLWTTPWHLLAPGIEATVRDPRFEIYIGPSGLDFDSITDDQFTELSTIDPTYVGPSSFGGTGPGVARRCFRVKDILPATPANFQSLYIRYAPTNIPAGSPNGVAVYNITAEAYIPGYELGAHSTSATFS